MGYKDKNQKNEYQKRWVAARRSEYMDGKSCVDCGSTDFLEVDHINQNEKVSHRIWSWSIARRDAELAKCVIRCRICHQKKTTSNNEHARGEATGSAKLTEQQVLDIRRKFEEGRSKRSLGREYLISDMSVRKIIDRRVWSHI